MGKHTTSRRTRRSVRLPVLLLVLLTATTCSGAPSTTDTLQAHTLPVETVTLKEHVRFFTALTPPRTFTSQTSMTASADYVREHFERYGLATRLQRFVAGGRDYVNVIGVYDRGKESGNDQRERLVVGAHYDVHGKQPGADDNASAVAGLLELARLVTEKKPALDYTIEFVAFALEEQPFFDTEWMGSYVHAKSLHDEGASVRGMICLEMIGYFTDEENSQEFPLGVMSWLYPDTGNFIAVIGNFSSHGLSGEVKEKMARAAIGVESLTGPSWITGVDFSDHRSYWAFDYPAVMITDTAFYRNPNYHLPTDTFDTLDFEKMTEVVRGVYWAMTGLE